MSDDRDDRRPADDGDGQNPFEGIFGMLFGPGGQGMPFPMPGASGQGGQGAQGGMPQGMPFDPAALQGIMGQLQTMLSGGDPVKTAQTVVGRSVPTPDPSIGEDSQRAARDAFRLAELWLEKVVDPAGAVLDPEAVNRRDWAKRSMQEWSRLSAPIRRTLSESMTVGMQEQLPPEMAQLMAGAGQMIQAMGDSLFAAQLGEGVAALSGAVLSGTESGLPLFGRRPILVEANIPGAAAEIGVDATELRIYLAVRELAHLWLFARSAWLTGHVETVMAKCAAAVDVDLSKMQDLAGQADPSKIAEMGEDLRRGLLRSDATPEQREARTALENLLSVIEGWCDVVAYEACAALTGRDEIREALRSRAATESRAEADFAAHTGISLRPRRLRDAAALFAFLEQSSGAEARDRVLSHPDLLPTAEDLDDPLGYEERRADAWSTDTSIDEALNRILSEGAEDSESESDEPDSDDDR